MHNENITITEHALQLVANATRPSELPGIIDWAEKSGALPTDLDHIIDACVKRKEEME